MSLIRQLESLRKELEQRADSGRAVRLELPAEQQQSAENLLHYLALRSHDLQPLQDQLARLGLSSLGRAEPHVMAAIDAVLHNLYRMSSEQRATLDETDVHVTFDAGAGLLERNTIRLLGDLPQGRRTHIMVTMPAEAASDYMMVNRLLDSGMDCMRINCAHDDPPTWSGMIKYLRDAERASGKSCRILMDLGGPKLRTGPMELLPAVVRIKPVRDSHGHVLRRARIWLTAEEATGNEVCAADACLVVDREWLADCKVGDRVLLRDARDSNRRWRIREITPEGCWADGGKTTYVVNGTVLRLRGYDRETAVRGLPRLQSDIRVRTDDVLLILNSEEPGKPALHDDNGELLSPGRVSLPIPEIYRDARRGETVCFDDGRIAGIIEKKNPGRLQVRITHTRRPVEKLAADKGVNFPDTQLGLPALGEKDLQDLEFAALHADMVGLSFANRPDDVRDLRRHLLELDCKKVGVVLKIETKWGFANLPDLILEAMKFPACGVMIARGDLAVECGFERLAEVQEEILWVCESAHVPVVWATQVLEGLTKQGHASRAEITDAAMSGAAECVMLNKGPHITQAVRTLDNILRRMQGHHAKKRSLLRKLQLAQQGSE
jgi:pyruvate kinase